MRFLLAVFLSAFRFIAARPNAKSAIPHGYYGDYNNCKLQVLPWPSSVSCEEKSNFMAYLSKNFSIVLDSNSNAKTSGVLINGISRYSSLSHIHPLRISRGALVEPQFITEVSLTKSLKTKVALDKLALYVEMPHNGLTAKQLDDDESYTLDISVDLAEASSPRISASLRAKTVWGALYGLETFSQIVETGGVIRHVPLSVSDAPRFPWRGLLMDTANHYLSLPLILKFLDAMAAAKMNVLHWHLVDSYSFPYLSDVYPEMAAAGAWVYEQGSFDDQHREAILPNAVYSTADLKAVVDAASERGIRIVLEVRFSFKNLSRISHKFLLIADGHARPWIQLGAVQEYERHHRSMPTIHG
jgi:hypothetical protein